MSTNVSKRERAFLIINNILMILVCLAMIYPLIYVFGHSFMSDSERALYPLRIFPKKLDWAGYKFIFFSKSKIGNAYMVTIMRTLLGSFLNVLLTSLLAYPLSKKCYPGRRALTAIIVFTMWFSGGIIPNFLLIKSLNLHDTFWVYIFPCLIDAFYLIILRNFFMQIPEAIEESAKLDGANDLVILFGIIIPLSMASIATITLFYAIYHWNTWFDAMLYVNDKDLWSMQYMLRQLIASANVTDISDMSTLTKDVPPAETLKMSTIIVATVPILCVYPFLQKYFVKGVLVGSVKG